MSLAVLAMVGCSSEAKVANYTERARVQFEAGDYDQAEIGYLNALRLDPTNRIALRDLGVMALQQGRLAYAFTRLSQARFLDTNDLDVELHWLLCQVSGGATNAYAEVSSFLSRQPTNGKAMLLLLDSSGVTNLAQVQQLLGSLPDAARSVPEYHVALGAIAQRNRNLDSAEASFRRALTMEPGSSEAHGALGTLSWDRNDRTQALAEFKSAAGFAPTRSPHQIRYADALASTGDTNGALSVLEEVAGKAPDYLPVRLRMAVLAMAAGDLTRTEGLLGSVLRRDAVNLEAMQQMAHLRTLQGDLSRAVAELDRAVELYPRIARLHYRRAVICLANNDLAQANKSLNDTLAIQPDHSEALLVLAQLNIRRGDLDSAVKQLTRVLQARPQWIQAQILLATAYRGRGDLEGALKIYQSVALGATNDPQPAYLAGLVLREQGRRTQARESFETALKRGPGFPPAVEQLVYLDLAENNFAAAQSRARLEIGRNPSNAAPYLLLAKVHMAETNLPAAKEVLQRATAMAPGSTEPMALLARVHVAAKEDQAALKALTTVVASNTNDVASWMQIGVLHEAAGNYAAAGAAYEKLLKVNPRYGPALNNLAYILSEHLKEQKRAYELASRARDLFPKDPYVADTFGWVLYRNGDFARALTLVSESVRHFPDNPELQYHLGMIHYTMGGEAAARIALQNAVERGDPKAGWIGEARKRLQVLAINPSASTPAALKDLEGLIAGSPDDPVLQMRAATAYERAGEWSKAAEAYERALAVNTNLVPAMVKLAELWSERLQNLPRAMAIAKRARELDSSDPTVAHTVGRIAFDSARVTADFQWSHGLLRESARGLPENPEVLFDLARAAYAMGQVSNSVVIMQRVAAWSPPSPQTEAARLFLEFNSLPLHAGASAARIAAVLKLQPDYVPALMASAALMQAEGKSVAARDLYEKILGRYPAFSPAYKPLALLYNGEPKDLQKAYDFASKARESDPTDMQAARILGGVAYERGLYPAAVQFLKQSAQAYPSDGDLFHMLGLAQHKTRASAAECKESLTRALSLAPDSPFANESRTALAGLK